jgi:hypothetical protein
MANRAYGLQVVDVATGQCTYRHCVTKKLQIFNTSPAIAQKLYTWLHGIDKRPIQEAVPELTDSQRELMLTGLSDEEWNDTFPEEPKEEGQ